MGLPKLTIGIEEEYQIIHAETRELTSFVQEFLEEGREILRDQIKPEFLQSQVEVGSRICQNMKEARQELVTLRSQVCKLAASKGLKLAELESAIELGNEELEALNKDLGQKRSLASKLFGRKGS